MSKKCIENVFDLQFLDKCIIVSKATRLFLRENILLFEKELFLFY